MTAPKLRKSPDPVDKRNPGNPAPPAAVDFRVRVPHQSGGRLRWLAARDNRVWSGRAACDLKDACFDIPGTRDRLFGPLPPGCER